MRYRWICEQPWCNGNLAATGASYRALVALIIGGLRPGGSEAIFATEGGEEAVGDVRLAGGVRSPYIAIRLGAV